MTTPLQRLGGPERLRDGATWLLAFIGAFATVAGLTGRLDTLTEGSLLPVGAIALAVVVVTLGLTVQREFGLDPDEGGRPATADALVLYQAEDCPHCRKVRRLCTRNGISYTCHNPRTAGTMFTDGTVTNRDRHTELEGYGQDQVPLLVDRERGESLYESDDIVAYLEEHYAR
ncbi:glutathione S-transferase N-terminal domain-containing protein [Haloglomus litoreum]|uniref:glutathione S-transferase N-terminal domain-containing protein n=1 Tax=Haloglomus litoreum TaxID=3034026 RepID=UPI0023E86389|nr:glutathione S-transferase N-terminal domain-containing protein [Haloglomus sp. DT116]